MRADKKRRSAAQPTLTSCPPNVCARLPAQTQLSQPNPTTSLLTTLQRLDGITKKALTYLLKHCPLKTIQALTSTIHTRIWSTVVPALWRFKQSVSSQEDETLHDELKEVLLHIYDLSKGLVVEALEEMDGNKKTGAGQDDFLRLRNECERASECAPCITAQG